MKKYFVSLFVMLVLFTSYSQSVNAQRAYVSIRPTAVVTLRTEAPSRNHVWVGDEWSYRNGRYENVSAHWEVPPRNHHRWIAGRWNHENGRGHYWTAGHWG